MPHRRRTSWPSTAGSRPNVRTTPSSGTSDPVTSRTVVVLPAPFGPSRTVTEAGGTSSDRSTTPRAPANERVTPSSRTVGARSGTACLRARVIRPSTCRARGWSGTNRTAGRHPGEALGPAAIMVGLVDRVEPREAWVAVVLRGVGLTPADVRAVARDGAAVEVAPEAMAAVAASRALVDGLAGSGRPVYGVSTGFGSLATVPIPPERRADLQL